MYYVCTAFSFPPTTLILLNKTSKYVIKKNLIVLEYIVMYYERNVQITYRDVVCN